MPFNLKKIAFLIMQNAALKIILIVQNAALKNNFNSAKCSFKTV